MTIKDLIKYFEEQEKLVKPKGERPSGQLRDYLNGYQEAFRHASKMLDIVYRSENSKD